MREKTTPAHSASVTADTAQNPAPDPGLVPTMPCLTARPRAGLLSACRRESPQGRQAPREGAGPPGKVGGGHRAVSQLPWAPAGPCIVPRCVFGAGTVSQGPHDDRVLDWAQQTEQLRPACLRYTWWSVCTEGQV